jgi:MFS family permease
MSPVGRLVLLRVASKTELVSAMAWLMIPASIGAIAGPPVGGFLVTYLSWRWIFYMPRQKNLWATSGSGNLPSP